MRCPKCSSALEKVPYSGVDVDRCVACHGLWFDATELERLLDMRGSQVIDTGDPEQGKRLNAIDRYPCPRCKGPTVRMVDREQTHVWYEQCFSCGGVWLDAGEFRDLKHDSIADFFRDIFTRERR